jgi:hypothetical protein
MTEFNPETGESNRCVCSHTLYQHPMPRLLTPHSEYHPVSDRSHWPCAMCICKTFKPYREKVLGEEFEFEFEFK